MSRILFEKLPLRLEFGDEKCFYAFSVLAVVLYILREDKIIYITLKNILL